MQIQVFIDGGNFHHLALKPLGIQETEFDFDGFADFLAGERMISDMGKRYYVGTVREKEGDVRSKEKMAEQTKLFNELKKTRWEIKTSKLRERTEKIRIDERVVNHHTIRKAGISEVIYKRQREKGIDVKLAVDLMVAALDNKYDVAIIVSSDTDMIPVIDLVRRRFNKKVEYIGFSIPDPTGCGNDIKPTHALISRTDTQRVLVESDIRKFILPLE